MACVCKLHGRGKQWKSPRNGNKKRCGNHSIILVFLEQKEVKKVVPRSGGKRTSSEGVSGAAVEAFLAKRQKELKHKAG